MRRRQSKKSALFTSIISMILCIAMLVGTTMAWFTDTVSVSGNKIQSGTLDIELQYLNGDTWENAEGKTLQFQKAAVNEGESGDILWEPGCTYEMPQIKVINKGNLALEYNLVVSGIDGDAELLEVIDFNIDNSAAEGVLIPGAESNPIIITGHMDENAGNGYQGLELSGISITVYATQTPYEYDSYGNQYDANAEDKVFDIIIPDENMNPAEEFDVYEVHENYPLNGNGGFAVVAEFDGAPGQIYVARTTSYTPVGKDRTDGEGGTPWAPMAMARVEDPDGNLVALYDFSDLASDGVNAVSDAIIIDIPEGKAGIWTIRVMNGQPDDVFEIGIKDPEHWGVRGENVLEKNLSGSYYLYTQKTATYAYVATDSNKEFALYKDGTEVAKSASTPRNPTAYLDYSLTLNNVDKEAVYELRLPEDFDGTLVVDGIPALLCPTAEDAAALKGAWVEEDGIVYQGALQARAREELVKLVSNNDLTVTIDKPEELPELENAIAEAQLFGAYAPISSLSLILERQIIDPDSPLCGLIAESSEWDYTNHTVNDATLAKYQLFQSGDYTNHAAKASLRSGTANLASLAVTDLQLNYLYNDEAIIKRSVLSMLYWISIMSEIGEPREKTLTTDVYPHSNTAFACFDMVQSYVEILPYLDCIDESAREVLREGMLLVTDKFGDYTGQGPTNQAAMGMGTRLYMYRATQDERYLDAFERQYDAIIDNVWPKLGVSDAGYFVESSGCDSSYEHMNRTYYYLYYLEYKKSENADANMVEKMRDMIEKTLEFEALFCTPNLATTSRSAWNLNHFTSRTKDQLGSNAYNPAHEILKHEFPMAARRWEVMNEAQDSAYAVTYPRFINDEAWALNHIAEYYGTYDSYYQTKKVTLTRVGSNQHLYTFDAFNSGESVEACELPCEREDGFLREVQDGIVALKHKGLYFMSFYRPIIDGATYNAGGYGGGAPSLMWSAETGAVVLSRKHSANGASLNAESKVIASCIYGTDENGTFFVSGKEIPTLTWIEAGKSFVISGETNGKTVSWKYELTETGIDITASLAGESANGDYWINLPIAADLKDADKPVIAHSAEDGTLTVTFGEDQVMKFAWDNGGQTSKVDTIGSNTEQYLRIKLDPTTLSAKISVSVE